MSNKEPGVPLAHYRQHGADVELGCIGCAYARTLDLETVIARLDARGLDGAAVGMVELARHVTEPCPRCGGREWYTRPAMPPPPGLMGHK